VETDPERVRALAERWTLTLFASDLWRENTWLDFPILQLPNDLFILQELIVRQKPQVVVETGTFHGGSAIFHASVLNLIGGGRVISVDVRHADEVRRKIAAHALGENIVLVTGDSIAPETVDRVREALAGETRVMVCLDSHHGTSHVLAELRAYQEFVPLGGYLVAFDTICEALGILPGYEQFTLDNPRRAVAEFLRECPNFEVDSSCDRLLESFCPGGFLRRVR
jgi:cephalosporin hydroxylase